ncbi:MAG: hypothetical protein Q4B68_02455 [Bacteroidales bacterium]|nr:hypothetical protein [Bacteroidales bacterium]
MKHLIYILFAAAVVCTASCSKPKSANSIQAQAQAVDAVERLVAADSADTMAMHNEILKAEAIRSQYQQGGDSIAAEDFDNTFRETLLQKSPRLAKILLTKKE